MKYTNFHLYLYFLLIYLKQSPVSYLNYVMNDLPKFKQNLEVVVNAEN